MPAGSRVVIFSRFLLLLTVLGVKKWSNLVTFLSWNNGKMDDMYAFIHFLIQTEIKRNCQKLHIIIQFSNLRSIKMEKK